MADDVVLILFLVFFLYVLFGEDLIKNLGKSGGLYGRIDRLEEVLCRIDSNLKRIADSLEKPKE